MVLLFYTTYISVDLAHHEIFHAQVGKGGINDLLLQTCSPASLHRITHTHYCHTADQSKCCFLMYMQIFCMLWQKLGIEHTKPRSRLQRKVTAGLTNAIVRQVYG